MTRQKIVSFSIHPENLKIITHAANMERITRSAFIARCCLERAKKLLKESKE